MKTLYKYKNRKIYFPETHSYIKAEQLLEMVRRGEDVCVLCNRSKADITADVLLSILALHTRKLGVSTDYVTSLIRGRLA